MNKKFIVIIILIIFLIFPTFLVLDYLTFYVCRKISQDNADYHFVKHNFNYEKFLENTVFPKNIGENYKKKGILIFGEGLAQGAQLEENQTLGYFLSHKAKRPVYNRAASGKFLQHAILQIENHSLDDLIKKSEYALIIIPSYHDTYRLKTYPGEAIVGYDLSTPYDYPVLSGNSPQELKLKKHICPTITSSAITRLSNKLLTESTPCESAPNLQNLFNHIIRLKNDLTEINPDIKLIVIPFYESVSMFDPIKDEDKMVFFSVEEEFPSFRDKEENFAEENIPSGTFWKKVADKLVTKLKL